MRLLSAVTNSELKPTDNIIERIYSCLLCGACSGQCPAGVDIMEAIYHGRWLLHQTDKWNRRLRMAVGFAVRRPAFSREIFRLSQPFIRPFLVKKGLIGEGFYIERDPLHKLGSVFSPQDSRVKRGRIVLFAGCNINYLSPHLGESLIRVMNSLDFEVVLINGEVCCGAPLLGLGMRDEAREFATRNIKTFKGLKADYIVSLCPTCVVTLRKEYPELTGEGIDATDTVSFLSEHLDPEPSISIRASYHDPCHSIYGLDQKNEPRDLLKGIGVDLIDMESGCCGFAGTFSIRHRKLSELMLKNRSRMFEETGAEILVTSCPGCMLQLSKSINHERIFHIIEIVEEAMTNLNG